MNEIVKVLWEDYDGSISFDAGLVVGCDPDIGITIVNADNTEEFLICLRGPLAPNVLKGDPCYTNGEYKQAFDDYAARITLGVVDLPAHEQKMQGIGIGTGTSPSHKNCPFGQ